MAAWDGPPVHSQQRHCVQHDSANGGRLRPGHIGHLDRPGHTGHLDTDWTDRDRLDRLDYGGRRSAAEEVRRRRWSVSYWQRVATMHDTQPVYGLG